MMHYDSKRDGDFDEWLKKQQEMWEEIRIDRHNKNVIAGIVLMVVAMSLLGAAIGYLVLR
jgi:hypothetical protein